MIDLKKLISKYWVKCQLCGEWDYKRHGQAQKRKYCSRSCSSESQKDRTIVQCNWCDDSIDLPKWRIRQSKTNNFYCSECNNNRKIEVDCKYCGSSIKRYESDLSDNNFCSRECAGKHTAEKNFDNKEDYSGEYLECPICGDEFYREPNQIKRGSKKYCSRKCFGIGHRERMSGDKNPVWRGGHAKYYGPNWKEQRRKTLKRDNFECQKCGEHQKYLDDTLHVHHKTPLRTFNRNFNKANVLDNLVSLCKNCHMYVEWEDNRSSSKKKEEESGQNTLFDD